MKKTPKRDVEKEMEEEIWHELIEIEDKEEVLVLFAVEAGSRAWGFASPNSDYDVRFIYVRPEDEYLRLEKRPDVIEWKLNDRVDINGWDLKKALTLLHGSNPALFEWNHSPIVYELSDYWKTIRKEVNEFFQLKAGFHHYIGMAERTYKGELLGEKVKLKKYFHAIRAILAAKFILATNCTPPTTFGELAINGLKPGTLPALDELRIRKSFEDLGEGKPIPALNQYIEENIKDLRSKANQIPRSEPVPWERLNEMFRDGIDAFYDRL